MDKELFEGIVSGFKQAIAYANGEGVNVRITHVPTNIDVCAIRKKLGMTQKEFSNLFGFSLSALRKWEQGQRVPERPIRDLLRTIGHNPEAVLEANRAG